MADITVQSDSPFDAIRKFRDNGSEFWNARELMPLLGYKTWQKFSDAINRAIAACENAQNQVSEHFLPTSVNIKSVGRPQENYELSRFSCYLIAMNGDPRKSEIASAQSYFAVMARQGEIKETILVPAPEKPALPSRDIVDYVNAADILARLPDNRLTRLLSQRFVHELSLDNVNQKLLNPAIEVQKQYTTATVRASQLGYSAKQIGNGTSLGKFVKAAIEPDFVDWQGQYKVNHFEVNENLDSRIHLFFGRG